MYFPLPQTFSFSKDRSGHPDVRRTNIGTDIKQTLENGFRLLNRSYFYVLTEWHIDYTVLLVKYHEKRPLPYHFC